MIAYELYEEKEPMGYSMKEMQDNLLKPENDYFVKAKPKVILVSEAVTSSDTISMVYSWNLYNPTFYDKLVDYILEIKIRIYLFMSKFWSV